MDIARCLMGRFNIGVRIQGAQQQGKTIAATVMR
jgi:hypothetical protein